MAESLRDLVRDREERDTIVILDETLKRGFSQIPNVVLTDTKLSDGAIVVYGLLLGYAWQTGSAFPGQDKLAEKRGKSIRQIQRYLNELREHNYLDWKQRGLNKTNVYYILSLKERFRRYRKTQK